MSKVLVAYFSAGGVTARLAAELAAAESADLFEIVPAQRYSPADLDWTNKQSRSTVEMSDPDCRPPIIGKPEDLGQYELVFLGFPIWWGREPSVVDTFLTELDFRGKRIVPFCSSGGSGIGRTADRIRSLVGEGVTVDEGRRIGGEVSAADLKLWMEGLLR